MPILTFYYLYILVNMKTKEARPLENKRQHEILTTSTRFFMGLLFYVFNAKTHKYDSFSLCFFGVFCYALYNLARTNNIQSWCWPKKVWYDPWQILHQPKAKKKQKSSNLGVQCLTTKRLVDIGQFDGKSIAHSIQIINHSTLKYQMNWIDWFKCSFPYLSHNTQQLIICLCLPPPIKKPIINLLMKLYTMVMKHTINDVFIYCER